MSFLSWIFFYSLKGLDDGVVCEKDFGKMKKP